MESIWNPFQSAAGDQDEKRATAKAIVIKTTGANALIPYKLGGRSIKSTLLKMMHR
ncbi:hypothetical protein JOE11_002077 [Robbsia andropogonis]|uniref:hypothetical protein n=1 Tax=Robbsia andropogonis TaxID=28092 RepID=UPI001F3F9C70|nr:hypothetical protein [Robbsia andropogonis]